MKHTRLYFTTTLLVTFALHTKAEDPVLLVLGGSDDDNSVLNTSLVVGLINDYECTLGDLPYRTFGAAGNGLNFWSLICILQGVIFRWNDWVTDGTLWWLG